MTELKCIAMARNRHDYNFPESPGDIMMGLKKTQSRQGFVGRRVIGSVVLSPKR